MFPLRAIRNKLRRILFFCFSSAWFKATANGRVSTKFSIYVIDTFCVRLKMGKNGSLLGASNCEKRLLASSCLSVRLYTWTNFMKLGTWIFFEHDRKIQVSRKSDKKNGSLTFFINSRSTFLLIKNVSGKSCRKNQNTHFVTKNVFSENRNG